MNKERIFIIGIMLVALIMIVLTRIINDDKNKTLELTYQTNGGVPYKWEYYINDPDIVEFVKSYEVDNQNKNGLVGAPININYVFKGLKKGETTITFRYVSIVDGTIEKEEINNIKVDGRKNITLFGILNK